MPELYMDISAWGKVTVTELYNTETGENESVEGKTSAEVYKMLTEGDYLVSDAYALLSESLDGDIVSLSFEEVEV